MLTIASKMNCWRIYIWLTQAFTDLSLPVNEKHPFFDAGFLWCYTRTDVVVTVVHCSDFPSVWLLVSVMHISSDSSWTSIMNLKQLHKQSYPRGTELIDYKQPSVFFISLYLKDVICECMKPSLPVIYSLKPFLDAFILHAYFFFSKPCIMYVQIRIVRIIFHTGYAEVSLYGGHLLQWFISMTLTQPDMCCSYLQLLRATSLFLPVCLSLSLSETFDHLDLSQAGVPAMVWSPAIKACPQTAHLPG